MLLMTPRIVNNESVKRLIREMPEKFNAVMADASNKAATVVKSRGRKLVRKVWNSPKDEGKWGVERAKPGDENPTAHATVMGGRIGLFKFTPSRTNIMGGKTTGGVSVLFGGQTINFKHAFVAQMRSGRRGIFERQEEAGKRVGQYPIKEMYGLATPQMAEDVTKQRIPPELAKKAEQAFEEAFIRGCEEWLAAKGAMQ